MKKLPSIFQNNISKHLNNNDRTFYLLNNNSNEHSREDINIDKKINDMFKSSNYIYKIDAEIIMKDGKIINKRIIAKNKQYLITNNNELILISNIKDIKKS